MADKEKKEIWLGDYKVEVFTAYDLGQHCFDLINSELPDEQIGKAVRLFADQFAPKNKSGGTDVLIHSTSDRNAVPLNRKTVRRAEDK